LLGLGSVAQARHHHRYHSYSHYRGCAPVVRYYGYGPDYYYGAPYYGVRYYGRPYYYGSPSLVLRFGR